MARNQQLCFLAVVATLFCTVLSCSKDDLYVIGSRGYPGLVLDGSDSSLIRLQYFSNSTAQLWKFQKGTKATLYYIINNFSGKALDFQPNGVYLQHLVAKDKRNAKRQQWSLRLDGRIENSQNRRCIDVREAKFAPGTDLNLYDDNGNQQQEFILTKVQDFDFEDWKEK